jgi:glucose/arabinose dehydrogenase
MRNKILILALGLLLVIAALLWIVKSLDVDTPHEVVSDYTFLADTQELKVTVVARDLNIPWEIIWGPDENIWFTQRNGFISRLNPESGDVRTLTAIKDSHHWTSSGTLGMALHPKFPVEPYLYVLYTFLDDKDVIMERCVRYTYNAEADTLLDAIPIIDNMNTGLANYGSRILAIENKLFITLGHGAILPNGQFATDTIDPGGLVVRINFDGTVPRDNPWKNNPVVATGFRNPQGLTVGSNGIIYISEHGPSECDEINIIEAGKSYGWPYVRGACDNFPLEHELEHCEKFNTVEPIKEWTPTIAPCGLQYYGENLIPEWNNSLLLATLKESDLRVLKLSDDGLHITKETIYLDNEFGRLRDVCVSTDGRVFVSTSNTDHDTDDGNEGNDNYILKIEPMEYSNIQ